MKKEKNTDKVPFYKKNSFKYSSLSTALIAIFLALIVAFNILATVVAERFTMDIDLTSAGDYTISEENRKVIEGIDKPVQIIFTTTEEYYTGGSYYQSLYSSGVTDSTGGKYLKQTVELLKNYKKLNSNISLDFIDASTPAFDEYREQFAAYINSIMYGDLIIYCKETDKHKFLSVSDLYTTENASSYYTSSSSISGSNVETSVTSALDFVTSETDEIVTVITGYNSTDTTEIVSLLEDNNYQIKTIDNLLKQDIPAETDVLLLASPTVDLTSDEVKKIDTFLENGGKHGKNLLYFGSSSQLSTPNLDELLLDWGIKMDYGTVFETDENYALSSDGLNTAMMIELAENDAVTDIAANDYASAEFVGSSMRPMSVTFEENSKYHTYEMLKTTSGTTIMPKGASEDWRPASNATKKSNSAMILSVYATGDKQSDGNEVRSSVCAISGIECVAWSSYYTRLKTNNLIIDTLNYMVNKDENSYTFVNKEITTSTLTVTEMQTNIIKIIFWAVPVVIIALGIVVYYRRKSR